MIRRRKWSDLTSRQKRTVQLGAIVQFVLLGAALWDIWHRPAEDIKGGRRLWTAISFVNFVGPLAYFLFGRRNCC